MFTNRCSANPLHQRFGLRPVAHCPAGTESQAAGPVRSSVAARRPVLAVRVRRQTSIWPALNQSVG